MKHRYWFLFFSMLVNLFAVSQEDIESEAFIKKNITKPSILSTHTFGVHFSRIQGHFNSQAPEKKTFSISIESGNVWSPATEAYIPKNEADRQVVRTFDWDQAHRAFDESTIAKDSFYTANDGVIKGFKATLNLKLAKTQELQIRVRTFLLTKGKLPFSILTGDKFIEGFHKNIAGGDDPFDRKIFGLEEANIEYRDRNNNSLKVNAGNLFATGIETSYYYYPESLKNKNKTFAVNFGAHLGINLSKSNSSIDFGLSSNILKTLPINYRSIFNIGTSLGALRKGITDLKSNNADFGTNNFIGYSETALEYSLKTKKGAIHTFGANFYIQTSLNKKDEFEYIIPIRNEKASKSWGHGVTNLYENNDYWTLIYSFKKKVTTSLYLQQDFTVINNPDIQTGISVSFNL